VTYHSCGRYACIWTGDFTSDDGTDVRDHVQYVIDPPDGTAVGDRIPAMDTGGSHVFPPTGSLRWLEDLVFMALAPLLAVYSLRLAVPRRCTGWIPRGARRRLPDPERSLSWLHDKSLDRPAPARTAIRGPARSALCTPVA
jgi:hypothetical protein